MAVVEGVVAERVYLGTTTQLIVELAPGARIVALEQNTARARADDRWELGDRVRVGWRPEHGQVLRDERHDVLVLGAGLAGLAAARDLAAGGADVLGARGARPAGRARRAGGARRRPRACRWAARWWARSTRRTSSWRPSSGWRPSRQLRRRAGRDELGSRGGRRRRASGRRSSRAADDADAVARIEAACVALARDGRSRDDPWAIPTPPRWTRSRSPAGCARTGRGRPWSGVSTSWARSRSPAARPSGRSLLGVAPHGRRRGRRGGLRLRALGGACGSPPAARRSRCAWPTELGDRVRLGARGDEHRRRAGAACTCTLDDGEELRAEAVVCALPVGPLRDIAVTGVSDARLASLHRQRQALAAKVVAAYSRADLARRRARAGSPTARASSRLDLAAGQRRALDARRARAARVLPRRAARRAAAPRCSTRSCGLYGDAAARAGARCSSAPGASTPSPRATSPSGRRATSRPSGRCTATHEPPFYVAGSDHWVAGYMEGAVRTGRAAAAAALGAPTASVS